MAHRKLHRNKHSKVDKRGFYPTYASYGLKTLCINIDYYKTPQIAEFLNILYEHFNLEKKLNFIH